MDEQGVFDRRHPDHASKPVWTVPGHPGLIERVPETRWQRRGLEREAPSEDVAQALRFRPPRYGAAMRFR